MHHPLMRRKETDTAGANKAYKSTAVTIDIDTLMNNAMVGMIYLSANRRILKINQKFCQMSGYSDEEILNKSVEVLHLNHEHFIEFGKKFYKQQKIDSVVAKWPFRHKTHQVFWCKITGLLINPQDIDSGIIWFVDDISEEQRIYDKLMQSEMQNRLLVDKSPFPMIVHAETVIHYLNQSAIETLKGSSPNDFIGRSIYDFIHHTEDMSTIKQRVNDVYSKKVDQPIRKEIFQDLLGGTLYSEVTSRPIEFDGKPAALTTFRNVTKQVEAEKALTEHQLQLQHAQQIAKIGSWSIEHGSRAFACSDEFYRLLGYKPQSVTINEQLIASHIHPHHREWSLAKIQQAILSNIPFELEFMFYTVDKRLRWGYFNSELVTEKNHIVSGYRGVFQDITDRKNYELELEKQNERIQNILDLNPNFTYIFDIAASKQVYVNFITYELLDIEPRINNISSSSLIENIYPEDTQRMIDHFQLLQQADDDSILSIEFRIKTKANKLIWLFSQHRVYKRNTKGEVTQIIGAAIDITLQKETERKLKENREHLSLSARAAKMGYWTLELPSMHLTASPESFYILSIKDSHANDIYHSWKNRVHKEDFKRMEKALKQYLNGKTEHFQIEYRIKDALGQWKWLLSTGQVVHHDSSNKPQRVIGVVIDITNIREIEKELIAKNQEIKQQNCILQQHNFEIKAINEELKKAKEKAEESDKLKSAFLQNMSHEIRTPMNGIIGFTEFLRDPNISEDEREEYINIINQSSHQLLKIVNDILDISRIETGAVKLLPESFHLNQFLVNLHAFFASMCHKKGIELHLNLGLIDDVATIVADKDKLTQVINNLVSNAVKFTESGYIRFGYSVSEDIICFFVEDTGSGLTPEEQAVVFDRFVQTTKGATTKTSGTGLGLAIAKGLVEVMQGRLWLKSVPNEGSTFYFTLPLKYDNTDNQIQLMPEEEQNNTHQQKVILVAEDEESNFMFLEALLRKNNFIILRANDGNEAIDICNSRNDIDLVLMDIKMPGIDGYEATKTIKNNHPELPIVAQTAYAMTQDRQRVLNAGCDDYISKPIQAAKLLRIIQGIIKKS